jgi:hypothetical protein
VGNTKIIHMLGINPFQAQSFPSQNRMLSRAGQGRAEWRREKEGERETERGRQTKRKRERRRESDAISVSAWS